MIITKVDAAVYHSNKHVETMTEKPRATRSEVSDVLTLLSTELTLQCFQVSLQMANIHLSQHMMATIDKNAQTLFKRIRSFVIC